MKGDQYRVQSLLKPNSSNKVLVENALNNIKDFDDHDIVILWPNRCYT